jgi:hypothetical protein
MPPTSPTTNWNQYFTNEASKPEYGTFDKFDDIPPKYVEDAEEFKEQINSNSLETILLIPGADRTVRVLHNCAIAENDPLKVSGIFGLKRYSSVKQIAISSLIKPFSISGATTRSSNMVLPTVEDFKGCASGNEFVELVGTGTENINTLEGHPISFWLHPHLMGAYITQRQVKVESIGESFALAIEGMNDEDATLLTNQYYHFLVFVWAVANGHAQTTIKLFDPPDDDDTDELLRKAQRKLDAETREGGRGRQNNRNNTNNEEMDEDGREEDKGRDRSPDVDTPGRRSRSGSPRDNRREERGGRRSRSRITRTRSRSRSRSKSRSRSRSPARRRRSRTSSPSPRGRGDNRRGQPEHSPNRERDRSPDERDFLRQLSRGVAALAQAQNENLQKDRAEKSVLGKLSERQKDLFTLLAAKDWYDTHPKLNRATERLLSCRAPEKQWNLIEDWSRKWPGLVSKQGVVQFLSSGYASKTLPGGFTVFMFSPLKHRKPTDKKDRIRNIRGTFGKEGSLDDEAIDFYATLDYFVPTSISDAETQLEMAVHLLEALTHRQGIAIDGYLRGLDIIGKHRLQMYEELAKDNMFMARFLHFLDMVFNNFCDDLAEYHTRRIPIESARRQLRGRMKDDIDRVMRDIHHGITPNLPLPSTLSGDGEERSEPSGATPKTKSLPVGDEDKKAPAWWIKNPEVVSAWALPDDKSMKELFTNYSPQGKENIKLFPKVPHHNPAVSGKKSLCIKYQCKGKCRAGCPQAHVKPAVMAADVKAQIASAFEKAYT